MTLMTTCYLLVGIGCCVQPFEFLEFFQHTLVDAPRLPLAPGLFHTVVDLARVRACADKRCREFLRSHDLEHLSMGDGAAIAIWRRVRRGKPRWGKQSRGDAREKARPALLIDGEGGDVSRPILAGDARR